VVLGAHTIRGHRPMIAGQKYQERPRTFQPQMNADERRQVPPLRSNPNSCPFVSIRGLILSFAPDYNAQRGKVREASVNARSNLRQFGSNRSTNRQNRLEWFSSLIWQSSCKST
jgi:hypothetical protein